MALVKNGDRWEVTVDANALRELLTALQGPGHLIREIQVTANGLFEDNPLTKLVKEFNQAVIDFNEKQNAMPEL